ncbi:hypothetical protein V6N11_034099 [Hibiscus sabdariffa]|uniref:RNase H type-1 domain-containing protein n=1 Tax=Hibiscus sabdariffa TaxID=183260 RepID=A0ABR2S284_9ROSI
MEAVNLLNKPQTSPCSHLLVRAIENLKNKPRELSIHGTLRQGNNVADALARCQDPHRKELLIHEEPPSTILQLLNNDVSNLGLTLDDRGGAQQTSRSVQWEAPPWDWCKVNVDGSRNRLIGVTSWGGVARDSHGQWMMGFTKHLGMCSMLDAEL